MSRSLHLAKEQLRRLRQRQRWLMWLCGGGLTLLALRGVVAITTPPASSVGSLLGAAVVVGMVACAAGLYVAQLWARRAENMRAELSTLQLIDDALAHERAPVMSRHPYRDQDLASATLNRSLRTPKGAGPLPARSRVLSTVAAFVALGAIIAAIGALLGGAPQRHRWTFTEEDATVADLGLLTPVEHAGEWRLQQHEHATGGRALVNDAGIAQGSPALAITAKLRARDLRASTRCRVSLPPHDNACGLVFRFQDPDNHYLARLDAGAGVVALAVVRGGEERIVQHHATEIARDTWHELSVEARADRVVVSWNGRSVIETSDPTLLQAGAVGLWVPSSGVAIFDELSVEALSATPHPTELFPFLLKQRS